MDLPRLCTDRNIISQAVIPGNHQSLGATERGHAHHRGIIDHIIGGREIHLVTPKLWREFPAMAALHLNSQVQQFGGFTPGRRVFGGAPKLPIGTVGNSNFNDCMNPKTAPKTKSMSLLRVIYEIRKSFSRSWLYRQNKRASFDEIAIEEKTRNFA